MHKLTNTEKEFLKQQGWSDERIADFKKFCDETDLEEEASNNQNSETVVCGNFEPIKQFEFRSKNGTLCSLELQKDLETNEHFVDLEYHLPDGSECGRTIFLKTTSKKQAYSKFIDIFKMDKKKPMHLIPEF